VKSEQINDLKLRCNSFLADATLKITAALATQLPEPIFSRDLSTDFDEVEEMNGD